MPYRVGEFRDDWLTYPVLVHQFHPELNHGITLTQVPPAADVWLLWECEVGHRFVATPWEQRQKPDGSRRRSRWCPECRSGAGGGSSRKATARICERTPSVAVGTPFWSECAPRPASSVEAKLRQKLERKLDLEWMPGQRLGLLDRRGLELVPRYNAIRVARPFFNHVEVWPDIVLPELRVAIEYDSTGRDGLEHVGTREAVDLRKDRALRAAGWEVIRIRAGKLRPIGPHDIVAGSVSGKLIARILDELRAIRGDLIVNCYLR